MKVPTGVLIAIGLYAAPVVSGGIEYEVTESGSAYVTFEDWISTCYVDPFHETLRCSAIAIEGSIGFKFESSANWNELPTFRAYTSENWIPGSELAARVDDHEPEFTHGYDLPADAARRLVHQLWNGDTITTRFTTYDRGTTTESISSEGFPAAYIDAYNRMKEFKNLQNAESSAD